MPKIICGLVVLVTFATVIAASTHWLVGLAIVVVPMVIVYTRLKLSQDYRARTDVMITEILTDHPESR